MVIRSEEKRVMCVVDVASGSGFYVGTGIFSCVRSIARSSPIRATKRYPSSLSHPNKDDDQLGVKASFQKKGGAVIPLWLERARAGTEHRKCNYKTSCAGNPKKSKLGVSRVPFALRL